MVSQDFTVDPLADFVFCPREIVDFVCLRVQDARTFSTMAPPSMFETPRAVANAAAADGYIQPNFGHALRIWWALFWRTTIIAAILQYGLGLLVRNLYASGDLSARAAASHRFRRNRQ